MLRHKPALSLSKESMRAKASARVLRQAQDDTPFLNDRGDNRSNLSDFTDFPDLRTT